MNSNGYTAFSDDSATFRLDNHSMFTVFTTASSSDVNQSYVGSLFLYGVGSNSNLYITAEKVINDFNVR